MAPTSNQPHIEQTPRPAARPNMMPQPQVGNFVAPNYNTGATNTANVMNGDPAQLRAEQIARLEQEALAAEQLVQPPQQPVAANPTPATTQATSSMATSDPDGATDTDKIEREWVGKVKAEIAKNSLDPYRQQMNISAMMRDYVKKRFGRVIGEAPKL